MFNLHKYSQTVPILVSKYKITPEIASDVLKKLESMGEHRGKLMRFIKKHSDKMDKDPNLKPLTLEQVNGFELDIDRSGSDYEWAKRISVDVRDQDWLVKLKRIGRVKEGEDDSKLIELLKKFHKVIDMGNFPNDKKDIMGYKDDGVLFEEMSKWKTSDEIKTSEDENIVRNGSQLLDNVDNGLGVIRLYKVTTPEAMSILAKGTNWCVRDISTAKSYGAPFYYFSMDNDPYILIHCKSHQIKNVSDDVPDYGEISLIDELIQKYKLNKNYDDEYADENDFEEYDRIKEEAVEFNNDLKYKGRAAYFFDIDKFLPNNYLKMDLEEYILELRYLDNDMLNTYEDEIREILKLILSNRTLAQDISEESYNALTSLIGKLFYDDHDISRLFTILTCGMIELEPRFFKRCPKFLLRSRENEVIINEAGKKYIRKELAELNLKESYEEKAGGLASEISSFCSMIGDTFNNTFFEKNKDILVEVTSAINSYGKNVIIKEDADEEDADARSIIEKIYPAMDIIEIRNRIDPEIFKKGLMHDLNTANFRNYRIVIDILENTVKSLPDSLTSDAEILKLIKDTLVYLVNIYFRNTSHDSYSYGKIGTTFTNMCRNNINDILNNVVPEKVRGKIDLSELYCDAATWQLGYIVEMNVLVNNIKCIHYPKFLRHVKDVFLPKILKTIRDSNTQVVFAYIHKKALNLLCQDNEIKGWFKDAFSPFIHKFKLSIQNPSSPDNENSFPDFIMELIREYDIKHNQTTKKFVPITPESDISVNNIKDKVSVNWYSNYKVS